jgi:hypothetical protein
MLREFGGEFDEEAFQDFGVYPVDVIVSWQFAPHPFPPSMI